MTKFERCRIWFSGGIEETLGDVVQTVLEEGDGSSSVIEDSYFLDIPVPDDSDQVDPKEGNGD